MTPDLLPGEIVGTLRPRADGSGYEFREGPVFTQVLLADELNRTGPKTQAALLEAMAEGSVTVDGQTHPLPHPFWVVATQNPLENAGVFMLPESQLDRFMIWVEMGLPDAEQEREVYLRHIGRASRSEALDPSPGEPGPLSAAELARIRDEFDAIHVDPSLVAYAQEVLAQVRAQESVQSGVSVRGGLAWLRAAQAMGWIRGRKFVIPQDLIELAPPVLAHRLRLQASKAPYSAKVEAIQRAVSEVRIPK